MPTAQHPAPGSSALGECCSCSTIFGQLHCSVPVSRTRSSAFSSSRPRCPASHTFIQAVVVALHASSLMRLGNHGLLSTTSTGFEAGLAVHDGALPSGTRLVLVMSRHTVQLSVRAKLVRPGVRSEEAQSNRAPRGFSINRRCL